MEPEKVIKTPILTEKSYELQEAENTYTFEVFDQANKIQIREAVEKMFDVEVEDVRTMRVRGKRRRYRFIEGSTSSTKKALVKLKPEHRIDLV